MKIQDFKILADENLHRKFVAWLREQGYDVKFVREEPDLIGSKDRDLIPIAYEESRIIITQDNDFGQIVFTSEVDFIGIIYLRPGHFPGERHIQTFKSVIDQNYDFTPRFILTAENKVDSVKIRIRQLG
jgi:predicted nuclease of predicted toxin-antitoxin system